MAKAATTLKGPDVKSVAQPENPLAGAEKDAVPQATPAQKPPFEHRAQVGDIVHFVDGSKKDKAAIVVRRWDVVEHKVDLKIFEARRVDHMPYLQQIPHNSTGSEINTWHHKSDPHSEH